MGNSLVLSIKAVQKNKNCSKHDFYTKVKSSQGGDELLSCSFGSWCREQRHVCGFSDKADYTSDRQSLLQLRGSPNKPDTTEGRYFQSHFRNRSEIVIHEKESLRCVSVKLPKAIYPAMLNHMGRRKQMNIRSARGVAYHEGLLIVQVNTSRHHCLAKFYIINVEARVCVGHFVVWSLKKRWYEVYMSPSSDEFVIRPDVRYHTHSGIYYNIEPVTSYPPRQEVQVRKVSPQLSHHSLTFNSQLGDQHIIAAAHRHIEIYELEDWSVTYQHNIMVPHASIQQIRSSPSGDYLAVRYIFPVGNINNNNILVLHFPQFTKVLQVDVSGAYWPLSELVNIQVFPRFSLSESCFALVKQHNYGRKVFVYKLPTELRPLQELCRRTILHLVNSKEVYKLPLPAALKNYITQHAK